MKIQRKLTFTFLFIAALAAVVGLIGWNSTNKVISGFDEALKHQTEQTLQLENIMTLTFDMQIEMISYIALADEIISLKGLEKGEEEDFFLNEIEEFRKEMKQVKNELATFQQKNKHVDKELVSKLEKGLHSYNLIGESILYKIYKEQLFEKSAVLEELKELEEEFLVFMNALLQESKKEGQIALLSSHAIARQSNFQFIGLISLVVFLAILLGHIISRQISTSLNKLKTVAQGLGAGKYDTRFEVTGDNEFNELGKVFNKMADDLQHAKIIKTQNEELNRLNKELKLKNDALDSFVYRVSHDLKAPTVNIEALLQLIKKTMKKDQPMVNQAIAHMGNSAAKLKQTIFDLLEVSRIEKRLNEKAERLELSAVANEVIGEIRTQIEETGAEIECDFSKVNAIDFSKANLKSLFANLMTNAIKYRSPERIPTLKIAAEQEGDHLSISFRDNGLGIDLEQHGSKLFKMFNRFHGHVEGSGVGLYIVNKVVTDSEGHMDVESKVGEGTCFKVNLPIEVMVN